MATGCFRRQETRRIASCAHVGFCRGEPSARPYAICHFVRAPSSAAAVCLKSLRVELANRNRYLAESEQGGLRRCRRCATSLRVKSVIGDANARLRQIQPHIAGRFPIAAERSCDRARLLIAGGHQKCRRPPVTFHADDVEVFFRLPQLSFAMWPHRAAAMQIGVDKRRQTASGFHRRVEINSSA